VWRDDESDGHESCVNALLNTAQQASKDDEINVNLTMPAEGSSLHGVQEGTDDDYNKKVDEQFDSQSVNDGNSSASVSPKPALIEVSSECDLKKEVIMAIPHEEGDHIVYIKEVIRVEYEWKPPHCKECKRFGHSPTTCPNHIKEVTPKVPSMADKPSPMEDQEEGFVESKFQYRPVSKSGKDMDDASNLGANGNTKGSSSQPIVVKASTMDNSVSIKNSFDALMDNSYKANETNKQTLSEWAEDVGGGV
ncbi:hypothetical protein Tco_1425514, partial [Tanacetum coccineum]